jgi:hypothetical protein
MDVNTRPTRRGSVLLGLILGLGLGVIIGAGVLRPLEPRSLLAWKTCEDRSCLRMNEITGLAAAAGLKLVPGLLPGVVRETPYTLAIRHPLPEARAHFVIIPKKDIKNIGELSDADQVYLLDAFALIQDLVKTERLQTYIVKTNGPGYQDVAYLHFHLMSK